jgi:RNA polymerase sigma factor (TIGR02999 family)
MVMTSSQGEITEWLKAWSGGRDDALPKVIGLIYRELRRLAARHLRRERPGHTLQTTALVHEAYLRLCDQENVVWQNRAQFYAIAARLMRRILIDYARRRLTAERKMPVLKLGIEESARQPELELIALDETLNRLAELDPQQSRLVELRYFGGLSIKDTAEVMGISPATVKREWTIARAWLHRELKSG